MLRRIILKPPDADMSALNRLADALRDAIDVQNGLATRSSSILRFSGPLQDSESAWWVEHEPATALDARELFRPATATLSEDQLLKTAGGLFDALATAHGSAGSRPIIHGGLCPGAVLRTPDGAVKVSDFGFAPAICKALGVESYLNLAVGPHPEGGTAWEVLPEYVADRDDRLCGFIDPDKYGQDSLASFEPGSDVIAAAMLLYLLAEHRHPYLYFEAEAHRVVDMARMMSFGVPSPFRDKHLCESPNPTVRTCCELVVAALARVPGQRPSAAELLRRLTAATPAVDMELVSAQRWVAQLEALLEAKAWRDLATALKDRPALKTWPTDLLARAAAAERRAQEDLARMGEQLAVEADHQAAQKWLAQVQTACQAGDWKAAQAALASKPTLKHWPDQVVAEAGALATRIEREVAAEKARAWQRSLQKAFQARDWAAVGRRFEQRPAPDTCPPEVLQYAGEVEAEYDRHLQREEHRRRVVEQQHREADAWLAEARSLARRGQWVEALDVLAAPPQLEHWPVGCREEGRRLTEECRLHLGEAVTTHLTEIEETVLRHAQSIVGEVLTASLAGLLRPHHLETKVEVVIWAPPGTDADGRARLSMTPRWAAVAGLKDVQSIRGHLDFKLRGLQPEVVAGAEELRRLVLEGLRPQLAGLQKSRLAALEQQLRGSVFPEAVLQAETGDPAARLPAQLHLLGADAAEGTTPVGLLWNDGEFSWEVENAGELMGRALGLATTVTARVTLADLMARSELLRGYESRLSVAVGAPAEAVGSPLPVSLKLPVRLTLTAGAGRESEQIDSATVIVARVGEASLADRLRELEAKFTRLIVEAQQRACAALTDELKKRVRPAPVRVQVEAPKRSKTIADEAVFELRPKGGQVAVLRARWCPATLTYDLPTDWEGTVAALLSRLSEAAATGERRREGPERTAEAAIAPRARRGGQGRRGLVLGSAAAGVVVVGLGLYFALRRPPPEPVHAPSGGADGNQVVAVAPVEPPATEVPAEVQPQAGQESEPVITEVTPPAQPPAEPGVGTEAPPVDLVRSLQNYWESRGAAIGLTDPQGPQLAGLLRAVAPEAWPDAMGQPVLAMLDRLAQPRARLTDWRQVDEDRVALTVSVLLRANNEPVAQKLVMRFVNGEWVGDEHNAAALDGLAELAKAAVRSLLTQARTRVLDSRNRGKLVSAHEQLRLVKDLTAQLAGEPDVGSAEELERALPPLWETRQPQLAAAGYRAPAESRTDPDTGYPTRLTDTEGRTLALVSVPPADELWGELRRLGDAIKPGDPLRSALDLTEQQRLWYLLYVDVAESPAGAVGGADAGGRLSGGRTLPTRDEWFLVALKSCTAAQAPFQDLFGGFWEWCADSDATDPPQRRAWVCGGSRLLVQRATRGLPPPPYTSDLGSWWRFLTHPLVMQRRAVDFGDDLTGIRGVLRVHPAE